MSVKTVLITTDGSGAFSYERKLLGVVRGIKVNVGDLSTPDIDVTDGVFETSLLSVNGVAADTIYFPSIFLQDDAGTDVEVDTGVKAAAPAILLGTLKIVVTGGGANKNGSIIFLLD